MPNEQQISRPRAVDIDGFAQSGLLIPSATGGVWPGGVTLGPDANSDDYAACLIVPVSPGFVATPRTSWISTDTSKTATLAAGGANTLLYLAGVSVRPTSYPTGGTAPTILISGLSTAIIWGWIMPSSGMVPPLLFFPPVPIPASAGNTAITVQINNGGGSIGFGGELQAWGFYRAV